MKIDEATNLVVPIAEGINCYHVPISREVFELNYLILSATKSAIGSKGIHYEMQSGPQIASLTLMDEARKEAVERGDVDDEGVENVKPAKALLAEIKRLTTVIVPGEDGFNVVPVNLAISEGHIDEEDWREAESALVFFTCYYAMAKRSKRSKLANATASLLLGSMTSLTATAYAGSLQTSMKGGDTQIT